MNTAGSSPYRQALHVYEIAFWKAVTLRSSEGLQIIHCKLALGGVRKPNLFLLADN